MGLIIIWTLVRKVDLMFCGAVLYIVLFHIQYAFAGFPITLTYIAAFFHDFFWAYVNVQLSRNCRDHYLMTKYKHIILSYQHCLSFSVSNVLYGS